MQHVICMFFRCLSHFLNTFKKFQKINVSGVALDRTPIAKMKPEGSETTHFIGSEAYLIKCLFKALLLLPLREDERDAGEAPVHTPVLEIWSVKLTMRVQSLNQSTRRWLLCCLHGHCALSARPKQLSRGPHQGRSFSSGLPVIIIDEDTQKSTILNSVQVPEQVAFIKTKILTTRVLSPPKAMENDKGQELNTNFSSQTFQAPLAYPTQNPEISHQKVWFCSGFRETYQTFWPPPVHVEDPHHPTRRYPDQKVWVWVPCSCLR